MSDDWIGKIIILYFLLLSPMIHAQKFEKVASWEENFCHKGKLNPADWNYYIGSYPSGSEYYTDSLSNVFIKKGKLHIVAIKDPRGDKVCSSGRVDTHQKRSFLYGKIDIKAKIPTGKGIFPAIWMLREDHPKVVPLGEIDIMEYIECFERKRYCTTTHIVEKEPNKKEIRHKHSAVVEADMEKFHIYSLEWTPTILEFKLDNKEVFKIDKTSVEFWPFDSPYYLILDVAYGSWGAQCGKDDNIFPCEMLIDWIKYYKYKEF